MEKSLLKLVDMGWYVLSSVLPIVPCLCPPQGAVPRAHGGWEDPRRIENDTAPHQELRVPGSNEVIISTNVLSGVRERVVEVADAAGILAAETEAPPQAGTSASRTITLLTYGKSRGRRPKCDLSLDASLLPAFATGEPDDDAAGANDFLRLPEVQAWVKHARHNLATKVMQLPLGAKSMGSCGQDYG